MHVISRPSPNYNERTLPLQYIVLHYTDQQNVNETLEILMDPTREVSAHYVVDYDGTVYQLVDDSKRAWHAGKGSWRGITDMNSVSIGIEIENPGHSHGHKPFTPEQIAAVIQLCKGLVDKHGLDPRHIIGHSDLAPGRKEDPGHMFPWQQLAGEGLGMWPKSVPEAQMNAPEAQALLAKVGYDVSDLPVAITAFQRHFCTEELGSDMGPRTMAMLAAVAGM